MKDENKIDMTVVIVAALFCSTMTFTMWLWHDYHVHHYGGSTEYDVRHYPVKKTK